MGDRIRAHDWAATPLGPLRVWPEWLRVAVNLCLDSAMPMAVYAGDEFRLVYNDAFTPLLAERHPGALGQPGAAVWPEAWHLLGPRFVEIIGTGMGYSSEDQRFDLIRDGQPTESYFQYSMNPLRDQAGRVAGIFNVVMDTTARVLAGRRREAEVEGLRAMYEQAPGYIAVSRGPEHVFEIANRAYRRLMGERPLVGLPVRTAVPELAENGFVDLMDRVFATGEPYIARRALVPLESSDGDNSAGDRFFDYVYQPITDGGGVVVGLFVEGTEVTDQVVAEERARADERRQAFRTGLADALGTLTDPVAVMAVASERLGRHLGASRVSYAEMDLDRGTALIEREWNDGSVASALGRHRLEDYGPISDELGRGEVVAVADVAADPRTSGWARGAGNEALAIAAMLGAPLVKQGRLVAALGIHSGRPREWSEDDRAIALEVAERIWAAVERARAEAALRRSEALHRSVVEQASDGIWLIDADGCYVDVNPAACTILGYTRDEYLALTVGDLILPENRSRLDDLMSRLRAGERLQEVGHFRRKDGAVVPLDLSLNCLPDGRSLAIGRDITERRRAEDDLRRSEARLANALSVAKLGTFEWTPDTGVVAIDDRSREIFGFPPGEGTRAEEVFGRIDPAELDRVYREANVPRHPALRLDVEYRIILPDGTDRFISSAGNYFEDQPGQPGRLIGVFADITERRRAEEALRQLAADLSSADHRKDEFLAMLAHELRNPLGAISGAVQLAGSADGLTPLDEFRDLIGRQVVHLTRLIDDLLDVSRITQGKIALQPETVDLATIVARAVEQVREVVARKHHELHVALPDGSVRFVADSTRAEQVLGNLLTNAAKYTEPGGRIDLSAAVAGTDVLFRVRDTGVGIDPAMLGEVFGLFTQVDATIDRAQGGLGIGLTLVRNLVEMHGGTVSARSDGKGHGSEFIVRLPIGRPDAEPVGPASPRPAAETGSQTGRVLVVDDNQDTARLTARMLRRVGFEVATAHDGRDAVDLAYHFLPTVVLLDIGLPGMNGYEVAAALRQHEASRGAIIIAISGYGEEKARERSAAAGFDHHLTKPVDFARLMTLIGG